MTVKTCLLVSDDPDDHQAFSEATSEISKDAVVLIILESQKALNFLTLKSHKFDYIFVDLFMQGIKINTFLKMVQRDPHLHATQIIVYGDESNFNRIENAAGLIFFNKDYEYSELIDFLKRFFAS